MASGKGISTWRRMEVFWGYIFVLPAALLILVWFIFPMVFAFRLSFMNYAYLTPDRSSWVGIGNYARVFGDEVFLKAMLNTFKYSIIVVPVQTAISLFLALICNNRIAGKTFYRVTYYIPSVTSAVAVATIFLFLFNRQGIANTILQNLGFKAISWQEDVAYALPLCMIMAIWASVGGGMLVYLAGLQGIPDSLLEAANIDGADSFRKLTQIIIPLLRPTTFFMVITGVIGTLQVFDQMYLTSGGEGTPGNSTLTMVLYIYKKGFKGSNLNMGYPSAMAFVLFAIILAVTLIQKKFIEGKSENY